MTVLPLSKRLSSIISIHPPYRIGKDVFIAKQSGKLSLIKYQMTFYLMMLKNILTITIMSEQSVSDVVQQVSVKP